MSAPTPRPSRQQSAQWEELLGQLSSDQAMVDQTLADLRSNVPGYENVPTASLEASVQRNIALTIRTIRDGREPTPEEVPEADALAVERYAQGVPIGSVLAGFRVSLSLIFRNILSRAPASGIPAEQILTSSTLLWALGDAFSTRAVAVYQDREVSRAVTDSALRAEWIRNVVTTAMPPAERLRGATLYGVPTSESVRAIVLSARPGSEVHRLHQLEAWSHEAGARVLAAVQGSSVVGIMLSPPRSQAGSDGLTIGLGDAAALEELPRSFQTASMALEAAETLGRTGVVDLTQLSWRLGVHACPETTEMLYGLHIAPLEDSGEFGQHILEAVDAYLTHRMSIPLAARSIPIHVNTLRYRLQRFSELTGADLGDLNTLIELSWVLAAGKHRKTNHKPSS
ncbi:PucR family transcriptional regulator [Nesterenkonia sphaerica]|uniref:PucR family transcriptional regulator n=1 Tax=Nesterenkonia sphaerica TaxID=1804988 RepID=A0A5R9ABW1_9MICC|nr:helix-turn-helix domain-containing protein [Nesterenkonia sphaerica]TLP75495.1 PucR family transcriptional regulator [Nesterenkonia sphaerica]